MEKPLKNLHTKANNLSSFRDPSGFVFKENGKLYRQINRVYKDDYELLMTSGLYDKLVPFGHMVSHEEVAGTKVTEDGWRVIKPEELPFISYPYEWPFSMLRDAAIFTLRLQKTALEFGMSLKDASAFNIQFHNGKPILIDTLSFERYEEGKPWIAYKQFVEHFLCPLLLMSMVDIHLGRMTSVFLDGIPVDITSSMLPFRSRLDLGILFHIHAHASSKKKFSDKRLGKTLEERKFGKSSLLGMLDSLESLVKKQTWNPKGTQWEAYYEEENNNYKLESLKHKAVLVEEYLKMVKPKTVWDMGANTGYFSRIAVKLGASVVAFDVDYGALEKNYQDIQKDKTENLLPLFCDLTNPTPALGWRNTERESLIGRGPVDAVMALALVHHLAISNNVPFSHIASFFSEITQFLIIEFVDKVESQVQLLLANRKDIFSKYSKGDFEKAFESHFTIKKAIAIKNSKRMLYLMERKG